VLCDECRKRPACMHITKIVNNQKVEKHLCEQCASEHGEMKISFDDNFSVHDFLKGIFNTVYGDGGQVQSEIACPQCSMTYRDFSRNGKIGCNVCYATFGERLVPLLRRIHGSSAHTGKVPKRSGGKIAVKQQLKKMRQELEHFVAREEYEEAAKLRDQIRVLEKQLNREK
jgi:protein arginine kinase activator